MTKYACFDIGNVLCHINFNEFIGTISKTMNITKSDVNYFLGRSQKLHDLGLTDLKSELHDHFNIHSDVIVDDILSQWNMVVNPEKIMFQLLTQLVKNDVKIALLSNIGYEHSKLLNNIISSYEDLNGIIKHFSCFVGARKPSSIYYQSFLLQHPEFTGCLYVDDLVENLEASKAFGFQTYHFTLEDPNYLEKVEEIEKLVLVKRKAKKNSGKH
jgi:FMN phosphatase YigB (HAD superfamily)